MRSLFRYRMRATSEPYCADYFAESVADENVPPKGRKMLNLLRVSFPLSRKFTHMNKQRPVRICPCTCGNVCGKLSLALPSGSV